MNGSRSAPECWYLTGPTASGKTGAGLTLAKRLDAEIVSLDSMAIYRGMDIGTAKPSATQREQVAHHLLDIVEPTEPFSVAQYVQRADAAIAEIRARGKQVLFVGGTPLYLKSLLRGLFSGPPADEQFRQEVLEEVARVGHEALHQRLEQVDPLTAARLHPHDVRRIIRALEVHKVTGQPISHMQMQFDQGRSCEQCRVFVIDRPRSLLYERIDQRVNRMIERGFVQEVRQLLERHGELGRTAQQAVGYAEVLAHLRGDADLPTTVQRIKIRTRQFARRQLTWFRSLSECRWIDAPADVTDERLVQTLLEQSPPLT